MPGSVNLTVQNVTLVANGGGDDDDNYGYAGIWVEGNVTINSADVTATSTSTGSGTSPTNSPALGIMAEGSLTIAGNSVVTAAGHQTETTDGGRAVGLSSAGVITIKDTARVTATADSASAAAAGIYSERGSVTINDTATVTASGTSTSPAASDNEGTGIAAGGSVTVNTTSPVRATGTVTGTGTGESAGIAAAVTPLVGPAPLSPYLVAIGAGANVTASGIGPDGTGVVIDDTNPANVITVATGATLTASGQGAGYGVSAPNVANSGTMNLSAANAAHELDGDHVTVGAQSGKLTVGTAGTATFRLDTNYPVSSDITLLLESGATAGFAYSPTKLPASSTDIAITTTAATSADTYKLKVKITDGGDSITSGVFALRVRTLAEAASEDKTPDDDVTPVQVPVTVGPNGALSVAPIATGLTGAVFAAADTGVTSLAAIGVTVIINPLAESLIITGPATKVGLYGVKVTGKNSLGATVTRTFMIDIAPYRVPNPPVLVDKADPLAITTLFTGSSSAPVVTITIPTSVSLADARLANAYITDTAAAKYGPDMFGYGWDDITYGAVNFDLTAARGGGSPAGSDFRGALDGTPLVLNGKAESTSTNGRTIDEVSYVAGTNLYVQDNLGISVSKTNVVDETDGNKGGGGGGCDTGLGAMALLALAAAAGITRRKH
ncbi:MAG: SYNERG-CTERM sorting domain-containing protein [Synergistaceae bacterium]|nr:SYNERG-CTERM sorting domain-containing protein [Synergistaceae bacterium]